MRRMLWFLKFRYWKRAYSVMGAIEFAELQPFNSHVTWHICAIEGLVLQYDDRLEHVPISWHDPVNIILFKKRWRSSQWFVFLLSSANLLASGSPRISSTSLSEGNNNSTWIHNICGFVHCKWQAFLGAVYPKGLNTGFGSELYGLFLIPALPDNCTHPDLDSVSPELQEFHYTIYSTVFAPWGQKWV